MQDTHVEARRDHPAEVEAPAKAFERRAPGLYTRPDYRGGELARSFASLPSQWIPRFQSSGGNDLITSGRGKKLRKIILLPYFLDFFLPFRTFCWIFWKMVDGCFAAGFIMQKFLESKSVGRKLSSFALRSVSHSGFPPCFTDCTRLLRFRIEVFFWRPG